MEHQTTWFKNDEAMAEAKAECSSIVKDLRALLETSVGADVMMVVGNSELPAHSQILAARSPVFAAMLCNDMKEARSRRIEITDMQEAVLRQMMLFIYTDTAPELGSFAADLLPAADKYDLQLLKEKCGEQMARDLSVENAAAAAALAVLHRCPGLRDAAVQFIARQPEVMASDGWARMQRNNSEAAVEICRLLAAALPRSPPVEASGKRILTEEQKKILSGRLIRAASNRRTDEVWALLDGGAPVDERDGDGYTALRRAVIDCCEDTVRCLIDAGADVNARDSGGCTPLHAAACRGGQQNIIWMLVAASAQLDVKNNAGETPLHFAARCGKENAIKALLLAGAKKDVKDNNGKTPADVATSVTGKLFNP